MAFTAGQKIRASELNALAIPESKTPEFPALTSAYFQDFPAWQRLQVWADQHTVFLGGMFQVKAGAAVPAGEIAVCVLPNWANPGTATMGLGSLSSATPVRFDVELNGTLEVSQDGTPAGAFFHLAMHWPRRVA